MGLTASTSTDGKLNDEELQMVQESWKVVMQNPEENGVAILELFLGKHNYYGQFDKFKGIPLDQLRENRTFRNHSLAIIKTINRITENVNNEDQLKTLLLDLGKQHGRRNIKENQFNELKAVILDVLRDAFGLDEKHIKAWDKTFDIAFVIVFKGLQQQ